MPTIFNLSSGKEYIYTNISPMEAIIAAYFQVYKNDYNTWDYYKTWKNWRQIMPKYIKVKNREYFYIKDLCVRLDKNEKDKTN